jgi:hypothetical protein
MDFQIKLDWLSACGKAGIFDSSTCRNESVDGPVRSLRRSGLPVRETGIW